ncbi:MAG: YHS domain-containing protein [Gallionellaceae bacterium]
MATDPVCKMNVIPAKAAAKESFAGQEYYFCSDTCHKSFVAKPEKYIRIAAPTDRSSGGEHK